MSSPNLSQVPISISSRCPVKPSIYRSFFDEALDDVTYRRFKQDEHTPRLLRVTGGPGCGKTTFASLAVQDLAEHDSPLPANGQQARLVISLFLEPAESNARTAVENEQNNHGSFIARFLAEIEKQVDADLKIDPNLTPPASPQMQPPESLLDSIRFKLRRFSRVFLVVDDIDCLWVTPEAYFLVEEQLELLYQDMGVRVMTTSRTPFRRFSKGFVCDFGLLDEDASVFGEDDQEIEHDESDSHGLLRWWTCDDPEHEKPEVICEKCYDAGSTCSLKHDLFTYEHHIRPMVDLDLGGNQEAFKSFIIHRLQLEHGAFWPHSHPQFPLADQDTYPPLSSVGRRLAPLSSAPDEVSPLAYNLIEKLSDTSFGNIAIALARIEMVLSTENLDEVLTTSDRLPPMIVSMFDGLVSSIVKERLASEDPEARARASLALHTLHIMAKEEFDGLEFDKVQTRLLEQQKQQVCCGPHRFLREVDREDLVDELLWASGGLLVSRLERDGTIIVSCADQNFFMYLSENYNELLSRGVCTI
ncbi:hypothetical protein QBC35DRAFT_135784 [Podospora australis]|uniref:Nephrocystin 3-like N-terminal domain-containing protein n=1 Tax=Podospora australis TaxID=1536484 RepID=A0AAN7ADU7_9PEZI|nr:hypothetical protein QBC35DRAFT_135784 [Podospora australis]